MSDNDRHVVPHADGGWDVKAPHAERASSHHDTQAEAIDRAREIIGNAGGGELVTHGVDGRIRESDTVVAARHDMPQVVEQPAVADGTPLPVDLSTTETTDSTDAAPTPLPVDPSTTETTDSTDAAPTVEPGASEDEDSKPTLGDKVKSLLHLSSD